MIENLSFRDPIQIQYTINTTYQLLIFESLLIFELSRIQKHYSPSHRTMVQKISEYPVNIQPVYMYLESLVLTLTMARE